MTSRGATIRQYRTYSTLAAIFTVTATHFGGPSALWALSINIAYDAAQSQPPSFDPTGARLGAVVQAAAEVWEDIIEDNWTMNLMYTWGDLGDDGARGAAVVLDSRRGRPTSARIRVDTEDAGAETLWYFDPTPTDHSEYELPQTLFRDLAANEQADWYNGSPPELLEVSFAGLARDSAPTAVRNGHDLLSVVLHEIGHTQVASKSSQAP